MHGQKSTELGEPDHMTSLRGLIAAVADLGPRSVICPSAGWSAPPGRARPGAASRYPSGLHAHGYPELCLAVEGELAMDIGDRRYVMRAPALALLPPASEHCEAWRRRRSAYVALWIVLARTGAMAFWNQYLGDGTWRAVAAEAATGPRTLRRRILSPAVTTVYDQLAGPAHALSPGDFLTLRADLLAMLASLHHDMVHDERQTDPPPRACLRPEVDHVLHLLDHDWRRPLSVNQLARLTRMAPNYLNRLFRQRTGRSIHRYLTERRMAEALRLCRQKTLSVKQIAAIVGYEDPLYFSRAFRRFHGKPPSEV